MDKTADVVSLRYPSAYIRILHSRAAETGLDQRSRH